MTSSPWLAFAAVAVLVSAPARAQVVDPEKPVFTAPMVHPIGSPPLGSTRPDAEAPAARTFPPVLRGHTPRTHADEVAEVFSQACVAGGGDPDAATDWALSHGMSPAPDEADPSVPGGQGAPEVRTAYRRKADDGDSLLLFVGLRPSTCAVSTSQPVDGGQLRSRLNRIAATWSGQDAPEPVGTLALGKSAARFTAYKFARPGRVDSLILVTPSKPQATLSQLILSIDDDPTAPR